MERIEPTQTKNYIVLSSRNASVLMEIVAEFRRGDETHRHGLPVRSKLLFGGPPVCGKTLCAEVFAVEAGLPLNVRARSRADFDCHQRKALP